MILQLPVKTPKAAADRDGLMSKEDKIRLDSLTESNGLTPDGETIVNKDGKLSIGVPHVVKMYSDEAGYVVKIWDNNIFEYYHNAASGVKEYSFDLSPVGNVARFVSIQCSTYGTESTEYMNAPIVKSYSTGAAPSITVECQNKAQEFFIHAIGFLGGEETE